LRAYQRQLTFGPLIDSMIKRIRNSGMEDAMATLSPEQEMLNWGRLVLDGVPYADLVAAQNRDPAVEWFDHWLETADRYERLGDAALAKGHALTAGELFVTGSLAAHYAQYLWFDDRRSRGQARKVELYRRAAPYLSPPATRFELPIDDTHIPGYLRLPVVGTSPWPCAILLGGLESTKEESYRFEQLLLDRGIATATFDGPGQGEMFPHVRLGGDFDRYTSRVIDHLTTVPEIDADRIGLHGRSLGALYALQSASIDHRIRACVAWGGFVDMEWDTDTPLTKESWRYVSQVATEAEARDHIRQALDIRPVLAGLSCPTYFLHGALDEAPIDQVDKFKDLAVNAEVHLVVEPEGDHCCHNLGPTPRLEMADWLTDQLLAPRAVGR